MGPPAAGAMGRHPREHLLVCDDWLRRFIPPQRPDALDQRFRLPIVPPTGLAVCAASRQKLHDARRHVRSFRVAGQPHLINRRQLH